MSGPPRQREIQATPRASAVSAQPYPAPQPWMLRSRTHEQNTARMNSTGLPLTPPRVTPVLDPGFRPAVLAVRAFGNLVDASSDSVLVRIALEQAGGSVFRFETRVLPESHPQASANALFLERFVKFLLWSRGGWRIYLDGPESLATRLAAHYRETATGRFDAHLVSDRMFDHPLEVVHTRDLPAEHSETRSGQSPVHDQVANG